MINDPFHQEEAIEREKETTRRRLFGVVCAVAITALLLVGYAFIRRFYSQQILANQAPLLITDKEPKGPPVAHILVDQPSLEKGMTKIGGIVKNTSQSELNGLLSHCNFIGEKMAVRKRSLCQLTPASYNHWRKAPTL
jgi:hypothetical protein